MKHFKLFVDESGREHKSHPSKNYTLVGCIVDEEDQHKIKIRADQIKYRYWKHVDIVFHSKEIGFNDGDFAIFKSDPKLKSDFIDELVDFLIKAPFKVTCAVVDKPIAYAIPWKHTTIIDKTTEAILVDFLAYVYLQKPSTGRVIIEASGYEKDANYLKSFNKVLTIGWERANPHFMNMRERLTSISFATKRNHDTESQIADLMGYAALCKYKQLKGYCKYPKDSFEDKLIKVIDSKLLDGKKSKTTDANKQRYFNIMQGFTELPPKKPSKTSKKPAKKKRSA